MADEMAFNRTNLSVFWAKTDRSGRTDGYHPLWCHLIDVGMVAAQMWATVFSAALRRELAERLGLTDEESAGNWLAFLAAIHDLGKLSLGFQLQNEAARVRIAAVGLPIPRLSPASLPHGTITAVTLGESLPPDVDVPRNVLETLASAIGGHHGVVPSDSQLDEIDDARSVSVGLNAWADARRALAAMIAEVFSIRGTGPTRVDNATALAIAGFVSVADWIGSNSDLAFFPFAAERGIVGFPENVDAYAADAARRAEAALRRLGWSGWPAAASARTFSELFPGLEPRPVQQAAIDLADRLIGPSLVILEVPMGEGKTEAALYLADRHNVRTRESGFYVALPTQATSNQMFTRVRDFLAQRYPETIVDLQLLHGHAALSAEFAELRRDGDRLYYVVENVEDKRGTDGAPAGVVASEWFTYRKRGLLSPFGVGTVDQALLAVLQSRHVFVRLFGLTHKVVIVDEVHAYDAYMSTLLGRLLEWLAALGSTVVLLSATLPEQRRIELVRAYQRGLKPNEDHAPLLLLAPYPRITWLDTNGGGDASVAVSERARKEVRVEWINADAPGKGERFVLGEALHQTLEEGGCAAVVVNTVGRAQALYAALRDYFAREIKEGWLVLDLLHARFPFAEREERERRSLARFGKPSTDNQRPFRWILVATQIVEQSLDLDFDLLVTDVAPVDLVLQRIGRLWRHQRDNRRTAISKPTVWLANLPVEDELPRFRLGDERVYDPHVMLRSWLALRAQGALIRVPDDVQRLVEAVYADEPYPPDASEALRARWVATRAAREAQIASDEEEARIRWLKRPAAPVELWKMSSDPREEDAPSFHQAHQALTRLAEPSVTLICLFGSADRPYLDRARRRPVDLQTRPTIAETRELLRNSLVVADRRVVWTLLDESAPSPWRDSPLLRHCRLRVFDADNTATIGDYSARLDPELGLVIRDPKGESD